MRYVGRISEWNDDKGFGFVTVEDGQCRAFVHMNAFDCAATRPRTGTRISYNLLTDGNGRFNAVGIRLVDNTTGLQSIAKPRGSRRIERQPDYRPVRRFSLGMVVAFFFFTALVAGALTERIPALVAMVYGIMSGVAIVIYAADKSAAVNYQWRTSEAKLHLIGLLGGWPGALFAQGAFRHKTRKVRFQVVFWLTVLLNCAGMGLLVTPGWNLTLPVIPELEVAAETNLPTITPLQR
jgi:uncharacterized membrane protein YsdA (DUF1294 family)/cold shock CspA family protein